MLLVIRQCLAGRPAAEAFWWHLSLQDVHMGVRLWHPPWPNIIESFLHLNIYSGLIDVLFSATENSCCGAPDPRLSSLADFPLRSLPLGPNVEEEGAVFGLDCTANLSNHQRQGMREKDRVKHQRKREMNGQTGKRIYACKGFGLTSG